ncbi:NAD-dependent epimerase/dehydratase family protein [uncultured Microbacterium sp.]|uniref:NAD-dependent epimerase/dehydratase n=1 Tax=uncultured Microbacterium sp. TaxID=191216 RepID=A0A1Y5PBP4_9MICO|nr:NAD-dependent epimerase/dehydratase family protein [uncultured Microbacterium sp.]SBS74759.1 NAD-dependent epimerase/dehydratase [uncultured Microbacterium sp.]
MTRVLVLGGTGWLSGRIARRWVDDGASVTCLARGGRPAPAGTRLIVADRTAPDAYAAVAGEEWDEIVDISSDPAAVGAAVEALGERAAHWSYVSSLSAYADNADPDADESAALAVPLEPGDEYDYSRAKSAADRAVSALGDRAAIARPGLIVGPGDPTDRFGYWPSRFALAGAGPVLVPDAEGLAAQVIDVDDLADFVVAAARRGWTGTVNAIGPTMPLAAMLGVARAVAGHTGALRAASPEWLVGQGVAHWAGPRSLPLWLPADMPGFATRRGDAYRAAGGGIRPLEETVARVLADERERGLDRARASGLTRAEELDLLAALA